VKLAHISDLHLTRSPLGATWAAKPLAALASGLATGRWQRFVGADRRIAALLEDLDAQRVDHVLCTGDLTSVSGEEEFQEVARLLRPLIVRPAFATCLPGNHDRYLASVAGRFERDFAPLCEGGRFPFVKDLGGGVCLVGVDSARPTSMLDSSGLVGPAQRDALARTLTDPALRDRFVVVGLHYGLAGRGGRRERRSHRLRDDREVAAVLDRESSAVDLVVHGHIHRPFVTRTARRWVVNAGSATDLGAACGYFVYDIEAAEHRVRLERRVWSAARGAYVADASGEFARSWNTRA
jgi:3',5'-cyclic AMP phosphodiesterase CpdA